MNGAIFFSSKYGSTAQYANWIGQATGLPLYDVKYNNADLSKYDFLILGSPIIYYKLNIHKWVKKHLSKLADKPIIFFSVSGAGADLNWMSGLLIAYRKNLFQGCIMLPSAEGKYRSNLAGMIG